MKTQTNPSDIHIAALAGGVGGARLAQGLAAILPPSNLDIIVNTGDDFEHISLLICPDLDTVMYTLAGISNSETGWGIAGDTYNCLESVQRSGGPAWFRIGDQDFGNHVLRTHLIKQGLRLTSVTKQMAESIGVKHPILPMCDTPMRTRILTDQGEMEFQEYFVRHAWQPRMIGLRWEGLQTAIPSPEVLHALQAADVVIFCPSNPFVSIDPILLLPGVREVISTRPTVAMSPILGGAAVKGPAAKMFRELGIEPSAVAVAAHYKNIITGFILDSIDSALVPQVEDLGITTVVMPTLMPDLEKRIEVAQNALNFSRKMLEKGSV